MKNMIYATLFFVVILAQGACTKDINEFSAAEESQNLSAQKIINGEKISIEARKTTKGKDDPTAVRCNFTVCLIIPSGASCAVSGVNSNFQPFYLTFTSSGCQSLFNIPTQVCNIANTSTNGQSICASSSSSGGGSSTVMVAAGGVGGLALSCSPSDPPGGELGEEEN
jgi:hypothetical protein